ncbi:hypothetical protein PI124_g19546 [Phytophthora idaei]|nr:hypothetical protein PI125_g18815 [Phytophthora idaei]KAG3141078.1 hypothetical protein PI126_g15661 [Phytophthora idaei]KAG3235423.1 hypothetical protein PI124_g19546 [Phytophthora idaei]
MVSYHWMDWIVMEHSELSFSEKKRTRKYTTLKPMPRAQLRRFLDATEPGVHSRIRHRPAGRSYGGLIDACTEAGTRHAAGIVVAASERNICLSLHRLLTKRTWVELFLDQLDYPIDVYDLSVDNRMFYVCDHA